ncbi:MAG: ABC transporter permease [Chloroflexota bacterium]|nr:ABC transporter permease [Chloroflexota bacterium]
MPASRATRIGLRLATVLGLGFIYVPLAIIVIYAFSEARALAWPIRGWSLRWWEQALTDPDAIDALLTSVRAALGATAIALLLGTLLSFAVQRYRFFGREAVSFVVILPIALPGIVTGMALNSTFRTFGIDLSLFTIVIGHATFCVVIVYNNVLARLRRTSRSIEEASMDLGADTWQTFRYVTFPVIRTALLAGGLLAFALSFDEVIVTTFTTGGDQTLPIYILKLLSRDPSPAVNVVAIIVILLSAVPVYLATRLSSDTGVAGGRT